MPDKVISILAEFTCKNHFDIKYREIDSILFIGVFENKDEIDEKIAEMKHMSYIYDHCIAEYNSKYYLFQFWIRPYD